MVHACIVVPPSPFLDDDKVINPLGAMYIKRYVQENSKHKVDILIDNETDFSQYDVVGFSAVTANVPYIEKLLPIPNKITVLGGPHVTFYRNDLSDKIKKNITFLVPGNGCKPFLSILNGEKNIDPSLDDKNQLPWRDLQLKDKYNYYMYGLRATTMITSRGCPNQCYFCEEASSPVRFKELPFIEKEIKECKDLGFDFISISDDLFCISLKRIETVGRIMKKYDMKFRCLCRANSFTEEMAQSLKKNGCLEVGFGAESGSQKILDIVNKKITPDQIRQTANIIKKYNMVSRASFIIGLPGETMETLNTTFDFIKELNLNYIVAFIYHPFRGTYIYDNIEQFDMILPENYDHNMHLLGKNASVKSCGVSTQNLSAEDIFEFHKKILDFKKQTGK